MKVLVLQSELGMLRGGGENFTRNLFSTFAARGHQVAAAFAAPRDGSYFSLPDGIQPLPLPGWWPMTPGQPLLSSIGRRLSSIKVKAKWERLQEGLAWRSYRWYRRRFQRRIEREFHDRLSEFDAVYVHGNSLLANHVARFKPTILRLPGPVALQFVPIMRAVPAVCANGDALIRLREFLGDHIIELPVGLDMEIFKPGSSARRAACGWSEQEFVLGYVGRLKRVKGVDLLASAFAELHRRRPHLRLVIIGHGPEERNIRSILSRQIKEGAVHMPGGLNSEDLPDWYRAMDLAVLPSRYENFSNTLLEAMACGVPFAASSVGGNKILAESGAGCLFEPGSMDSLKDCLSEAVEDPSALRRRGAAGQRYVRGRFTWKASADRLEWILKSRLGIEG